MHSWKRQTRMKLEREEDAEVPHQAASNSGSGLAQDHLTQVKETKKNKKNQRNEET